MGLQDIVTVAPADHLAPARGWTPAAMVLVGAMLPNLLLLAVALGPGAPPTRADEPPRLAAGVLLPGLRLDGVLDEPAWSGAPRIQGLTMIEPRQGATPSARTDVRVLADPQALVFGIICHDPNPGGIVTFTKERDGLLESEDHVRLILGPYQDGRSGYVFAVNPGGARYDALVASHGEEETANWDGVWDAATHRDADGWSVEIRIPIATLSFKGGLTAWHFNLERRIQRLQETDRWASPLRDLKLTQTSRAGLLTNLPAFDLGLGLQLRPAAVGGVGHPDVDTGTEWTGEPSLDASQRLGPNLLASVTVNTDFAETEVDTRQTNLTRFPLFFPEKRAFFLEGSDVFDFGLGTNDQVIPFFSRRIGLAEQREVAIRAGGKLSGRVGRTALGAYLVRTGQEDGVAPASTLGVVRVRQDLFGESNAGLIVTAGDPLGRGGAFTAGADFTYQTSHFRGSRNFLAGIWALATGRSDLQGDRTAVGFKLDYPNDLWDASFTARRLGESFDPALGFAPRTGAYQYRLGLEYRPRPKSSWLRQMFFELETSLVTDLRGRWESYDLFTAPLNWQLESGDRVEFNLRPVGEQLPEPFEIAEAVVIPAGPYHWMRYRLEVESAAKRKLYGQASWWFGGFYGGTLHQFELEGSWTPSPILTLLASAEHNAGRLPWGDFDETFLGLKIRFNLSPDLQVRSFVQYDTESRSLGTNTRLRWTFRPQGDLFVIYNHNLRNTEDSGRREDNQLLVKLQYVLRK